MINEFDDITEKKTNHILLLHNQLSI